MTICKICEKQFINSRAFSNHLKIHNKSTLEYFIEYESFKIPLCSICEKDAKHKQGRGLDFQTTCGDESCLFENSRNKRIDYLKSQYGGSAWQRRASGQMSYLEQWFFDSVILKNNLHEKFDIVNEFCEHPYFIDFAFLNIKLAVELDGRCHFKNGQTRIDHDIKRDKYLISRGWTVYRIKYDQINQKSIQEFLKTISDFDKFRGKVWGNDVYKYREIKRKIRTRKEYFSQRREEYLKQQKERISLVTCSEIDFSKYGWVSKVAKLIGMSPQKVSKWMSQILPDIYEKSFKRS